MSLNKHDELLLKDLKFQPLWLVVSYVMIGLTCFAVGIYLNHWIAKWICGVSGLLIGMGAEKLVTRRIRQSARKLMEERSV